MLLYSLPTFDESDMIDPNQFGFRLKLAWTPVVGNLVAVLLHFPWIFLIKISAVKNKSVKTGKKPQKEYNILLIHISW